MCNSMRTRSDCTLSSSFDTISLVRNKHPWPTALENGSSLADGIARTPRATHGVVEESLVVSPHGALKTDWFPVPRLENFPTHCLGWHAFVRRAWFLPPLRICSSRQPLNDLRCLSVEGLFLCMLILWPVDWVSLFKPFGSQMPGNFLLEGIWESHIPLPHECLLLASLLPMQVSLQAVVDGVEDFLLPLTVQVSKAFFFLASPCAQLHGRLVIGTEVTTC
mmetsp:Transcript_58278/g.103495  ORF Transcript_58278/g.103495 Transcript_58278/m.103495 type:complete len:221 (+) Transcript_58278:270-932(+)